MKKKITAKISVLIILSLIISLYRVPEGISFLLAKETEKITNLKQVDATSDSISLMWDEYAVNQGQTEEKEKYYYQIWTAPVIATTASAIQVTGSSVQVNNVETAGKWTARTYTYQTDISLQNLDEGSDFYVRVYAYTSTIPRYLVTTKAETVRVATKPSKITSCQIDSITSNSVQLSWNSSKGADYYKIYGTYQGDTNYSEIGTSTDTTYTVLNLSGNTKYSFYIVPVNQGGTYASANTSMSHVPVQVSTLPAAPANLSIINQWEGRHNLLATWDKNNSTGYEMEIRTETGQSKLLDLDTNFYEITNFEKNSWEKVRVRGYIILPHTHTKIYTDWTEYQSYSKQSNVKNIVQKYKTVKKKVKTKTGKKRIRKVKRYQKQVRATWDKVEGAASYTVYISTKPTTNYKYAGTTTKCTYTIKKCGTRKLKAGTKYYVKVISNNQQNNNAFDAGLYKTITLK